MKATSNYAMVDPLPKFTSPPVIETVLGVQFARLAGFSSALAGRYWASQLNIEEWPKAMDAPRLDDQFERFDGHDQWGPPLFRLRAGAGPERTQIVNNDDERMIQVQDSRFILNWRKRASDYPSYETLAPQFHERFAAFTRFVREAALGSVEPNQWEITYVNHVLRGSLWDRPQDWPKVLPNFFVPSVQAPSSDFETATGNWRYTLGKNRGRLHVTIQHGKTEEATELLLIQLTVRGPVDPARGLTLDDGLELGHEVIVRSFAAMTSAEAHKTWGRTV